jgi:hypothetical protein
VLAAVLIAAAAAAAWVPLAPWGGVFPTRIWRGYRPLLVSPALAAGPQDIARLAAAMGPGTISSVTAQVEIWDFSSQARFAVAETAGRLDPMDPRYDAWIAGVERYLRSPDGRWEILYVPASMPLGLTWLRAARSLGVPWRGEWKLEGLDLAEAIPGMGALFALAILSALSFEHRRRRACALAAGAAVLSSGLAWVGGLPAAASCVVLLAAWTSFLRALLGAGREKRLPTFVLRRHLFIYLGASAAGSLVLLVARFPLPAVVAGYAGLCVGLLLILIAGAVLPGVRGRTRRAVFDPVPILRPSRDRRVGFPAASTAAGILLLACASAAIARGAVLPAPSPVRGARDYSWDGIARIARQDSAAGLPDIAVLVTHDAYQETIAFGRPWRMPSRDERVTVREYITAGGSPGMVERLRTVKTFDAAWLRSVRSRALPGSVESMLFAQRRPSTVAPRGPADRLAADLAALGAALAALFASLARAAGRRPLIRPGHVRFNGPSRRNQVP